jgi:hydrogenase maturation protease
MSAAGPSQGANCAPSGGSAAADLANEAASVGAIQPAGVVVIAVGNRSRGDDAIGPLLLDRLDAWRAGGDRADDLELLEDFQLQIEHALDLADRRLVLFVDAGTGTAAPFAFYATEAAAPGASHSSHALAPEAVLGVYRQITGENPPAAFVLCVRGDRFELGEDLSGPARAHVEAAWQQLAALCARPDLDHWRETAARGRREERAVRC